MLKTNVPSSLALLTHIKNSSGTYVDKGLTYLSLCNNIKFLCIKQGVQKS